MSHDIPGPIAELLSKAHASGFVAWAALDTHLCPLQESMNDERTDPGKGLFGFTTVRGAE